MRTFLKTILKLNPIAFYNRIFNTFVFNLMNVKFQDFKINGRIFVRNKGKIIFGRNLVVNSSLKSNPIGGDTKTLITVKEGGVLKIGNNFGISNSSIFCTNSIHIGNNVMIGGSCKIYDTDFHSVEKRNRIELQDIKAISKKVIIEDNVFIGGHSIILKGVHIQENTVIGAGSVLTRSTGRNEIWAGNPATFIKKIIQDD